jgi:hypothetical protein
MDSSTSVGLGGTIVGETENATPKEMGAAGTPSAFWNRMQPERFPVA